LEALDVPHVHIAPDASWLSRRETNCVARFVEAFADAVDPSEAKGFVQSFCISDGFLFSRLFMETNQQFSCAVMVSLKPPAKLFG
jgi:hypothetical protein